MGDPRLLSIQVGRPVARGADGAEDTLDQPWTSAIFKSIVSGPVWLGRTNLAGDGQADLKNHGGPDKAVLAYSANHYPKWIAELAPGGLPYGSFGENFTIDGIDEYAVCIGDTFELGPTQVQVTQPRQPCWKLERRLRRPGMIAKVQDTNRSGWYLRVLVEGSVESGLAVRLLDRPFPGWTVARAAGVMRSRQIDRDAAAELAACPALSEAWRRTLWSAAR